MIAEAEHGYSGKIDKQILDMATGAADALSTLHHELIERGGPDPQEVERHKQELIAAFQKVRDANNATAQEVINLLGDWFFEVDPIEVFDVLGRLKWGKKFKPIKAARRPS